MKSSRVRQKSMVYLRAYEKSLLKFRFTSPLIFEIGCGYPQSHQNVNSNGMGGSLELFSSWLGQGTKVVGIDIIK
jgi:hypothetical protein